MQRWSTEAALRSYQNRNYVDAAITTFWVYDCVIKLDDEYAFLRYARLRKTKVIYILTRLLPFVYRAAKLEYTQSTSKTFEECMTLDDVNSGLAAFIVLFSEVLFALRTYALWRRKKSVRVLLIVGFIIATIGSVSTGFLPIGSSTTTITFPPSSVTGCFVLDPGLPLAVSYTFLAALEIELIILNAVRGVGVRRETKARLVEVLVRTNILYYMCGLGFSVANIIMAVCASYGNVTLLQDLQIYIHAILATRLHRMLWLRSEYEVYHGTDDTII